MSISTPPDLAVGRVSWTIGRGSSRALAAGRGVVRFRASAVAVNFSTATVLPEPVETPVLAGVMTPVDLIQNDPEVWNWIVEPLVGVQWEPFPIDVDGPVDLATAAQTPGKGPVRAVKGETGPGLTGEVRYQDGEVEFGIEDGTWTDPVTMPPGPPGPSNQLLIGTVDTSAAGAPAEASISGESPTQYLNLTLPRGEKPAITWQGSTIVVDGVPVQDLRGPKGDASTEPGPRGMSAYEYAVQAGFEGTEEEFAEAVLPEDVSWQNITGKPETYQPAAHQHDWADVTGTPATFPPATHSHAWADITGTPATFPPATHSHAWADITGKPATFPPAAHNHDSAYAAKPGEWIVLAAPDDYSALKSPWTPYSSPAGHYFQGARYRITDTDVIFQAMFSTPGAVGSTILTLPDGHGIEHTSILPATHSAGDAKVRFAMSGSAGNKQAALVYHSGPASGSWLNINVSIPRG